MTDGRVLSEEEIQDIGGKLDLFDENVDLYVKHKKLVVYAGDWRMDLGNAVATIRDLQRQVSELTQERDQLKRDNKDLNKRVHQMNGAGSYLAISTADLEQALRDVRFTVNDNSRPLENRMARVDYIVKQALSKQARQEDAQ
ncbi:hypothetical protein AAC03nite_20350 [Alicyclobacillus acidoterrestris]|nr:hypothetical protein AAC03nite_20350 [Alicyclobacillus acidoterrestris]